MRPCTRPVDPGRQKMYVPRATPGAGARLDRRRADLLIRQHVKQDREAVDLFLEQRLHRIGRDVAPGEPRAAGRDHHVDTRIVDPGFDLVSGLQPRRP